MKNQNEVHVKIGEVKVGKNGELLKATLGSCVGIAFFWPEKKWGALAHCLLPESPVPTNQMGAKYVNQAVPSLIALMKISSEDIPKIQVWVSGGGNMMEQLSRKNSQHIGIQNANAAKTILTGLGFIIKEIDVGGEQGRKMCIDCTSGIVSVTKFAKSTSLAKSA